jgi:hypothetical protein
MSQQKVGSNFQLAVVLDMQVRVNSSLAQTSVSGTRLQEIPTVC